MKNNIIKCPHCGKPVGEYIIKGSTSSPIGAILTGQPSYKKTVSNIYWREKMGSEGLLCRNCANNLFPEKKAYYVILKKNGHETICYGGADKIGTYTTKASATAKRKELTAKNGLYYFVREKEVKNR
nr:MAG TPA: Sarcosine oxidase, delta subunit family [Caudoviricetes sp.]